MNISIVMAALDIALVIMWIWIVKSLIITSPPNSRRQPSQIHAPAGQSEAVARRRAAAVEFVFVLAVCVVLAVLLWPDAPVTAA